MENALSSNDIQVFAEEWVGRSEVWNKASAAGKVVGIGSRWWARSKAGTCRAA
jgi:glycine betaine/proline transport system substrate-binding protein